MVVRFDGEIFTLGKSLPLAILAQKKMNTSPFSMNRPFRMKVRFKTMKSLKVPFSARKEGGTLFTKEIQRFYGYAKFKLPEGGNNGLSTIPRGRNPAYDGMCELQVLDSEHQRYARLDQGNTMDQLME